MRRHTRGLRRALGKTSRRTAGFLQAALTLQEPERELGHVAWVLVGGALACAVLLPPQVQALPAALGSLYLLGVLAPVCAIDARYGIIPDAFVIALALGGLAVTAPADLPAAVIGAGVILLAGYALQWTYRALRGIDGLGSGDVKFLAAATLWVGLGGVPWMLLTGVASSLVTLMVLRLMRTGFGRHDAVPFGPHLAAGLWLMWLFGLLQL